MCSEPGFGASVSSSLTTTGAGSPSSWEDVRRELSNDQVKSIHEMLWPKDTNIADLLPRPDRRVFRAVYMGFIDLRTIVMSVISTLAYFDEIVILNPFPNPVYINPTQSPAQHKSQTLKNVSVLLTLQPFIDAGIVHFVPDPMEFNADFRRAMMVMIEKRRANWKPKREEMQLGETLVRDEFEHWMLRLPEDELRRIVRESQPDIDAELLERTIEYMKEQLTNDPLALLQPQDTRCAGATPHPRTLRCNSAWSSSPSRLLPLSWNTYPTAMANSSSLWKGTNC